MCNKGLIHFVLELFLLADDCIAMKKTGHSPPHEKDDII